MPTYGPNVGTFNVISGGPWAGDFADPNIQLLNAAGETCTGASGPAALTNLGFAVAGGETVTQLAFIIDASSTVGTVDISYTLNGTTSVGTPQTLSPGALVTETTLIFTVSLTAAQVNAATFGIYFAPVGGTTFFDRARVTALTTSGASSDVPAHRFFPGIGITVGD